MLASPHAQIPCGAGRPPQSLTVVHPWGVTKRNENSQKFTTRNERLSAGMNKFSSVSSLPGNFSSTYKNATLSFMATTNLLDALAQGDPAKAFASFYDSLEVRTTLSPPIVVRTIDMLTPSPQSWVVKLLKPTVVLRGGAGAVVVAPAGPAGDGSMRFLGFMVALVGAGFVLGRWSKR